jgi:hypothetical protein
MGQVGSSVSQFINKTAVNAIEVFLPGYDFIYLNQENRIMGSKVEVIV